MEFLVNKICAGPSDPYLDNPSLEEMNIKEFLQPLELQIRDIKSPGHMKYYAYFKYGPRGWSVSGYGQLFLFPLYSPKHFSITSIPTYSLMETASFLYKLQDVAKLS